jgi:superfamily II DNA or RNA helicase
MQARPAYGGQRDDSGTPTPSPTGAPELRPYQRDVIERVAAESAAGRRHILLVAPTASGKTVIAAAITDTAIERGQRALIFAHRREIVGQTAAKLYAVGIDAGIIQAGFPPRPGQPAQVASIQTLHARAIRGSAIELPPADLVIIDEAHHARARTYEQVIAAYPDAVIIGLTATPCRGDGRGLGNIFEVLVECPQVAALVEQKYLVPSKVFAPSQPDLKGVRVQMGDYVESQLAERMDQRQLVGDIVTHKHKLAERRATLVFATGVKHSVHIRDEFRRSGVLAEHIDGGTPLAERERILKDFAAGKVELVTNAMVLTEGFDCPDIGCLILARPTKSLGLYRQMIGRALRPAAGKTDAIIIDHSGAVFAHGLPEDDIAWTLAEDERAENKAHAARGEHGARKLVDCPECHAVRFQGDPCPACGWTPRPKAASVDIVDGDLGLVQRDRRVIPTYATDDDRMRFYQQLLGIAKRRGYSPGFAFYKYQEKFSAKPPWGWKTLPPAEPEPHVESWVRSRAIAYAKAMARAS